MLPIQLLNRRPAIAAGLLLCVMISTLRGTENQLELTLRSRVRTGAVVTDAQHDYNPGYKGGFIFGPCHESALL